MLFPSSNTVSTTVLDLWQSYARIVQVRTLRCCCWYNIFIRYSVLTILCFHYRVAALHVAGWDLDITIDFIVLLKTKMLYPFIYYIKRLRSSPIQRCHRVFFSLKCKLIKNARFRIDALLNIDTMTWRCDNVLTNFPFNE